MVSAALTPAPQGHRRLQFEARKVVLDDLLALAHGRIQAPFRHAGIGLDRFRHRGGRHAADDLGLDRRAGRLDRQSGRARASDSDHQRRVRAGLGQSRGERCACRSRSPRAPPRYTLRSEFAAPAQPGGNWLFALGGGWVVLDPLDARRRRAGAQARGDARQHRSGRSSASRWSTATSAPRSWAAARARASPSRCPASSTTAASRGSRSASPAIRCRPPRSSGCGRASSSPKVRDWVVQHIVSGNVERLDIATNATLAALQPGGPPMPERGLCRSKSSAARPRFARWRDCRRSATPT